ncbi:MAG: AAA family ATPase, partial [Armatimonadetes bacterium]|nr:AAA family ATPase [Anaerolineae bacterium]
NATESADLYGVGVMAYELFAGRMLFPFDDVGALVNDILYSQPDIAYLDVSVALAEIIAKLLAKTPEARFESAQAVIGALSRALDNSIHLETEATRDSFLQAARFVGRERERDQLISALRGITAGTRGSLWLIAGESGVGKSRLTDELRTQALVEGTLVVQGHTVNAAGIPYQMWRPLFGWLPLLRDLTADETAALRALAPDLPTLPPLDPATPTPTLDPATAQSRVLKLLRDTLDAHPQPVLLLLEDLHWAGSESLALLSQLQAFVGQMRLLVIMTFRDDEHADLPRQLPYAEVMKLLRLSEDQIAELSEAMLGEIGSQPQVVDLLKRETEGNVFFIIEVIRTLAEEAGQLEQIGLMTLPQQVFAGGMWRIIQRRLAHVPDYALALLQLAAVSGRRQDLALLRALAPTLNQERWLLDCTSAAVLEVMDSEWRFTHDKLREGVLDGLTLTQRQALHAQVASTLETLYGAAPERIPALAYHWGMAENDAKELVYTQLAGEQSLRSGAYREAINALERALDLLGKSEPVRRIALLHALAEAHLGIGGYERAQRLYEESVTVAQQAGAQPSQAIALARLGDIAYTQLQYADAHSYYTQSHAIYSVLDDLLGVARALNSLGNVAYDQGDEVNARRLYQESSTLTRGTGAAFSAGAVRAESAAMIEHRDSQEISQMMQELVKQMQRGDKRGMVDTLFALGLNAQERGKMTDARDFLKRSATLARELDEPLNLSRALNALGMLLLLLDERTEARKQLHDALQAAQQAHATDQMLWVLFSLAQYFQAGSTIERALELLSFILHHPDVPDSLQDQTETLVYTLQLEIPPNILEIVWESGKTRELNPLVTKLLNEL